MIERRIPAHQLLATPEEFYSQTVAVIGYLRLMGGRQAALYSHFAPDVLDFLTAIWLEIPPTPDRDIHAFHDRYVVVHGTVTPSPPAELGFDMPITRVSGWCVLLEPVTYLIPLNRNPIRLDVSCQHSDDCEQLLEKGLVCPHCGATDNIRFHNNSFGGKGYSGGYRGEFFVCYHCGRSYGPSDVGFKES
jgi:hypothetical protein